MQESMPKTIILGVQMLFVAFGALVLVPILTGLHPSIALFTAGAGTLVFQFITKRMVPVFLASSFAFIAPISVGMKEFGPGATMGALFLTGLVYVVFAIIIKFGGVKLIHKIIPPIVAGPVIMVIGLNLAPVAIKMAVSFDASGKQNGEAMIISGVTLLTAMIVVAYGKKIFSLVPVLIGIIVGYLVALSMGYVNFKAISDAAWFSIPWVDAMKSGQYAMPVFDIAAIALIVPVAIAPAIEHIGDMLAISSVANKDFLEKPGLHRTILGDGIATSLAGLLGGPPNTTYSEVTGAVALTKATNPIYMTIAAITAIILAFVGKLGAILSTIPVPVMGGMMVLLFGMIAAVGIGTCVREKVDFQTPKNLVIASVILVVGIGGLTVGYGKVQFAGIGLAGVVGIVLNLILKGSKEEN